MTFERKNLIEDLISGVILLCGVAAVFAGGTLNIRWVAAIGTVACLGAGIYQACKPRRSWKHVA